VVAGVALLRAEQDLNIHLAAQLGAAVIRPAGAVVGRGSPRSRVPGWPPNGPRAAHRYRVADFRGGRAMSADVADLA
jgi:hypothetical protein